MSQKVILFLSELRNGNGMEAEYTCPNGSIVTGLQTNEAPVKYLLSENPHISEILCIVTPEAKASAWDRFCHTVREATEEIRCTEITYHKDFQSGLLPDVLKHIQPEDEIFLETTGGLRNNIMDLLLLSRILTYTGVRISTAVYSNFQNKRIEDVSSLIHTFDLISGVHDLSSFGNVQKLREYYGEQPKDEKIADLLTAMEKLTEAITLCRSKVINECMEKFNSALKNAEQCDDAMMRQLLPAFRRKFSKDKELTTRSLIQWCVDNGMLQQALTVYNERIPAYILNQGTILSVEKSKLNDVDTRSYVDDEKDYFENGFLRLAEKSADSAINPNMGKAFMKYLNDNSEALLQKIYSGMTIRLPDAPEPILNGIEKLCRVIQLAYTTKTSRYNQRWPFSLKKEEQELEAFAEFFTKDKNVPTSPEKALNRLKSMTSDLKALLLGGEPVKEIGSDMIYAATLEHMEELAAGSPFIIRCDLERMKSICRDYIYLKELRNMTNHANHKVNKSLEYLGSDYPPIDNISAAEIRTVILRALERLE